MRIEILKDKKISFTFFLKNVVKAKEWPWVLKGSLDKINRDLIDKASEFNRPITCFLDYQYQPLEVLGKFNEDFKKLIKESKEIHEEVWSKNLDKISLLTSNLKELKEKYLGFILDKICGETRVSWFYNKLLYIPCIYKGGSVEGNRVFIGIDFGKDYLASNKVLQILIHETAHSNVFEIEKKLRNKGVKIEATEIAVNLVVNKVIKKLNETCELDLENQKFNKEFLDLECYRKEFLDIYKEIDSYEEKLRAIDEFLEVKGYETVYKRE